MTLSQAQNSCVAVSEPTDLEAYQVNSIAFDEALRQLYSTDSHDPRGWQQQYPSTVTDVEHDEDAYLESVASVRFDVIQVQDYDSIDAYKAARQAKRKAQNRAAQRKFRERKDIQMRNFEEVIDKLKDELEQSKSETKMLQEALTEARIQVATLKSIIPSLANNANIQCLHGPSQEPTHRHGETCLTSTDEGDTSLEHRLGDPRQSPVSLSTCSIGG